MTAFQLTMHSRWDSIYNPTAGDDLQWEWSAARVSGQAGTPHEAYRLDAINVMSWPPGATEYKPVRQYQLRYAASGQNPPQDLTTDNSHGQAVLTLAGVQQVGSDGSTALPETRFTYGMSQGDALEPTAGWNRLLTVDNGQGGLLSFSYAHVWTNSEQPIDYATYYQNYYRVKERKLWG
jgi:hypothetical protein